MSNNSDLRRTPRQIEKFRPQCIGGFAGCQEVKNSLLEHLAHDGDGPNILISGETGTGKTSLVEAYIRTRNCPHVTEPLLGPCGECSDCKAFDFDHQDAGILAVVRDKAFSDRATHFMHLNCQMLTIPEIMEVADIITWHPCDRCIVYLDEVQKLADNALDLKLLRYLDELNAVWIATGTDTSALNPMFVRRFASRVQVVRPTVQELSLFLAERCREWAIDVDDANTLALLAQRSQQITAECINVLACAAARDDRRLNKRMVTAYQFVNGVTIHSPEP